MPRKRSTELRYNTHRKRNSHSDDVCDFCNFTVELKQIVAETKHFWISDNIFPYDLWDDHEVAEHLIVVPKQHTESIQTFGTEQKTEFVDILGAYETDGYSIYARAPSNKSKTVPHQHTHLIKLQGTAKRIRIHTVKPYFLWYK